MKKKYLALALTAFLCSHSYAQDSNAKEIDDKYVAVSYTDLTLPTICSV